MSTSIHSVFRGAFLAVFLATLQGAALAQPAQEVASQGDHPLFAPFPDSDLISVEFEQDVNYRLVLSGLQRTRGEVIPESSERLRGDVTKLVYEVSQEFSGADVYQFFREQLAEKNYTELFTCSGRGCGSSNYWANDIFRNRILYGPERNQYYLALRADNGMATPPHIALYIITRGNRRIYAYMEIIEVGGAQTRIDLINPSNLLTRLQQDGAVAVPDLEFTEADLLTGDSDLAPVVELLRADPALQVYLVAHLAGDGELQELLDRSLLRAEFVKQRLMDAGIDGSRIDARGLGPLAPVCAEDNCAERVELVLQ